MNKKLEQELWAFVDLVKAYTTHKKEFPKNKTQTKLYEDQIRTALAGLESKRKPA